MERWKENKSYIVITSLMTLVPMIAGILLWKQLPDVMATHFGAGNIPNGWSSKGFSVFGLPLICLVIHIFCTIATILDPKQKGIDRKLFNLILLICPITSLVCGVSIYGYALYPDMNIEIFIELFVGMVFVVVGNYLPKCRQNYVVGIKIPWTLHDEENWNHTHRVAGWIWVICGLFFMINAFLNLGGAGIFFVVFAIMIFVPVGYSFLYYMQHKIE